MSDEHTQSPEGGQSREQAAAGAGSGHPHGPQLPQRPGREREKGGSMENTAVQYVDFKCPVCGTPVRANRQKGGRKGPCPHCRSLIRIPKE
jgi:hypothetical protein